MGVPQELNEAVGWYDAPEADYAVIGDPVAHSLSPRMHVAAYRELGLDLRYLAVRVRAGSVGKALEHLRGLGYKGANVTLPHKEEAIGWLETCDDFARRVRAVNTIRLEDRYGFNTDAPGFLQTLDLLNLSSNTPALVLGAGGAARAVVAALADEGHPMRVWSRTRERAERMLEEIEVDAFVLDAPELTEAGLIVNATSATLAGEPLPISWEHVMPGAVAYDLAYGVRGRFLLDAEAHGLRTVDGLGMLVMQGALSFEWWLDQAAPHQAMWEAVR
ncbi:MAG: shikimate dehydrogenase [Fimbriimonas ginsengisoli]|uniref:Shikimate dehydrogenase (NADP(+)) n=1 Tax=Fimbriimonas ginsengisoli TaxID=1005039 RepID=A0A931PVD3_FIMGI|nr:shikimate dehydrogenase [Fimbriimonas ginsengisoli]